MNQQRPTSLATSRYIDYRGEFAMQKDSGTPSPAQLIIHSAMGAILGSLFGVAVVITNRQIFGLIASSSSPLTSMALLVAFFSFVFSVGATLSGFIFTAVELNGLEAKRQTERIRSRRDSGN